MQLKIHLVQGHCDLFEVSSKVSNAETTDGTIATAAAEENKVTEGGLQLSELISSITHDYSRTAKQAKRPSRDTKPPICHLSG